MFKELKEKIRKHIAGEPRRMVFKLTGDLNPETGNYICPIPGGLNVVFHEDGTCLGVYNPTRDIPIENEKTFEDVVKENGFEIELFDWYVNDNRLAKLPVLVDSTLRETLDNYCKANKEAEKENVNAQFEKNERDSLKALDELAEQITDMIMNDTMDEDIREAVEESIHIIDAEKEKKDAE